MSTARALLSLDSRVRFAAQILDRMPVDRWEDGNLASRVISNVRQCFADFDAGMVSTEDFVDSLRRNASAAFNKAQESADECLHQAARTIHVCADMIDPEMING